MATGRFYSLVSTAASVELAACAVRTMPPPTTAIVAPLFSGAQDDVALIYRIALASHPRDAIRPLTDSTHTRHWWLPALPSWLRRQADAAPKHV